jgi:UDP-2,3-diacylglucosamine pyrophosphatase LpxH
VLSTFFSSVHLGLQKFAFGKRRLIRFLERFDTQWLRLSAKVSAGALAHGRSKNAQRIFCGHTHEALSLQRDGLEYYNTGSWTQETATYITIDHGGVRICEYRDSDELLEPEVREELDFEDLLTE